MEDNDSKYDIQTCSGKFMRQIKRLRQERGLTLHSAAVKAGMTPAQLSNIENGKAGATLNTIVAMCLAYDVRLTVTEIDVSDRD